MEGPLSQGFTRSQIFVRSALRPADVHRERRMGVVAAEFRMAMDKILKKKQEDQIQAHNLRRLSSSHYHILTQTKAMSDDPNMANNAWRPVTSIFDKRGFDKPETNVPFTVRKPS
jgi:hypothetical protein